MVLDSEKWNFQVFLILGSVRGGRIRKGKEGRGANHKLRGNGKGLSFFFVSLESD